MPIIFILRLLQKQPNSRRSKVGSTVLDNRKWYLNVEGIRILIANTFPGTSPHFAPFAAVVMAITISSVAGTASFTAAVFAGGTASSSTVACFSVSARTLTTEINGAGIVPAVGMLLTAGSSARRLSYVTRTSTS